MKRDVAFLLCALLAVALSSWSAYQRGYARGHHAGIAVGMERMKAAYPPAVPPAPLPVFRATPDTPIDSIAAARGSGRTIYFAPGTYSLDSTRGSSR